MKFEINIFNLIAVIIIVIMSYFLFVRSPDTSELDIYKKAWEKEKVEFFKKATADSIKHENQLKVNRTIQDSIKTHYNKEALALKKTIKYYERKIYAPQSDPIYVVDAQYDSILSAIRNRYSKRSMP